MAAPSLHELIELGAPALLEHHGLHLGAGQRRALRALARCRTGALGATEMSCTGCGHARLRPRSCGHRSCPRCQHHHCVRWLERQRAKLLPATYFMVTFTLPSALRPLAYRHPREVYPLLFSCAIETLMTFGANHPDLRAELGATAVLHTHNRRLDYHPHLHGIVPGGGIDPQRRQWRALNGEYPFNGRALAKVFRAKLLQALEQSALSADATVSAKWVVHCKRIGTGLPALKYLARYLYRGVLSERDIVAFDAEHQRVTFRYRHGKSGA